MRQMIRWLVLLIVIQAGLGCRTCIMGKCDCAPGPAEPPVCCKDPASMALAQTGAVAITGMPVGVMGSSAVPVPVERETIGTTPRKSGL